MRKLLLTASAAGLFLVFNACSKSDNNSSSARTVENLSGSYGLTGITASAAGITLNIYDSLEACDKDNVVQLDNTGIAQFIDAGLACVPPSDSSGTWSLSANTDTIYVAGTANYIKSWNGQTLVLTSQEQITGFPLTATVTTTLVKK